MQATEIVKAWKDAEYHEQLTAEERAALPLHPAGTIEFGEPELPDESLFGPEASKCKFLTNSTSNKGTKCR